MALMCQPRVLLLDEPAAGMSVDGIRRMADLLRRLSREMAVVVIEHDMGFIRALDAPIVMLHQGKVFRTGSFEALSTDAQVRDVYLGRRNAA